MSAAANHQGGRGGAAIAFELDGRSIVAQSGETILQAARRAGADIPSLCYQDGMRADGNCRACMVEIAGERVLAASCCRAPSAAMKVSATSLRAQAAQRMVVEMLAVEAGFVAVAPELATGRSSSADGTDGSPALDGDFRAGSELAGLAAAMNIAA
ncbi:MAG: (2Fe-2S)-binding protein, partial [Burkholderiaceae bacterium]|nr:(2Fe-2S)-binding protein [Burkholderiaceae bacterium]